MDRFTTRDDKPVDVSMTPLSISRGYRFRYGSVSEEQKPYVYEGELELVGLWELSVKRNIFAYTILAQKVEGEIHSNANGAHEHRFYYEILDNDGDGKFETLLLSPSNSLVPEWALK